MPLSYGLPLHWGKRRDSDTAEFPEYVTGSTAQQTRAKCLRCSGRQLLWPLVSAPRLNTIRAAAPRTFVSLGGLYPAEQEPELCGHAQVNLVVLKLQMLQTDHNPKHKSTLGAFSPRALALQLPKQ